MASRSASDNLSADDSSDLDGVVLLLMLILRSEEGSGVQKISRSLRFANKILADFQDASSGPFLHDGCRYLCGP